MNRRSVKRILAIVAVVCFALSSILVTAAAPIMHIHRHGTDFECCSLCSLAVSSAHSVSAAICLFFAALLLYLWLRFGYAEMQHFVPEYFRGLNPVRFKIRLNN